MVEAFSHTVCFFSSLSHSRFLLFHQTLFCLVLHWTCILYVYLIHSCWSFLFLSIYFAVTVVAFTFFFISNSCRQRQKNQLCAYKKPVPMFNFWLCDLHVQLFRSSINWKWHYYSVQHGVGYFNVCFFLLLFYASLKRDILVLPGYSVSFDQIIYFQCKTQRLWRLQNFSIQLIVQRKFSGNWLNEEWFYKWNVFFCSVSPQNSLLLQLSMQNWMQNFIR